MNNYQSNNDGEVPFVSRPDLVYEMKKKERLRDIERSRQTVNNAREYETQVEK
jgi:hypothetical protein